MRATLYRIYFSFYILVDLNIAKQHNWRGCAFIENYYGKNMAVIILPRRPINNI